MAKKKLSKLKIKQSHIWDVEEILVARCPYCGKETGNVASYWGEGDIIYCDNCNRKFLLGKVL